MNATWEPTPCPSWCAGHDDENPGVDERVHHSVAVAVPVVSRRLVGTDPLAYREQVQEYEVGLTRRGDAERTWIYVGAGPSEHVEISLDSAGPLLGELLRQHAAAAAP